MTLLDPRARRSSGALELHRVGLDHWILRDHAFPPSDARHVLASLHETDDRDVEVVWLRTDISLRSRYPDAVAVLQDVASWRRQRRSRRKPVEIPSFPPGAP